MNSEELVITPCSDLQNSRDDADVEAGGKTEQTQFQF